MSERVRERERKLSGVGLGEYRVILPLRTKVHGIQEGVRM